MQMFSFRRCTKVAPAPQQVASRLPGGSKVVKSGRGAVSKAQDTATTVVEAGGGQAATVTVGHS